jgi:parvulin-like peptidyl-prolyl isomerase
MGLGLVAGLILLVLAIGLIQTYVIEPNAPVATVNGEEITTREYQNRDYYERFVLEDQYQQIASQLSTLPPASEDDQFSQFLQQQYQQMANQVLQQRSAVDRQTLDQMIADKLIQAEADKRGLTVSDAEITETINRKVAARQGGLTAASAEETSTAVAAASATAALWTPTPTFTPAPTLTSTTAITPTATPMDTPVPQPTATPNIISSTDLSTAYTVWAANITTQTGLTEVQYREFIRKEILQTKLAEALGNEVPRIAEQANARHILVKTEDEAKAVIKRLEAGEDFAALAKELSLDTGSAENGGELGFVPKGRIVAPVENALFSLPIGQISEPVETQFGWHVIEVLAREDRELTPGDYSQQQRAAFTTWLSTARAAATIEDSWTQDKAPADPFMENLQQQQGQSSS